MVAVTATKLPPEIILGIVSALGDYDETKWGLAACSLVCMFWASLLREKLFRSIDLRSPDDFKFLLHILRSPTPRLCPPLSLSIHRVTIRQFSGWSLSTCNVLRKIWSHLAPHRPIIYLWVERSVWFSLPTTGKRRTKDYIPFLSLPHTLPGLLVPVRDLVMTNVQMRRRSDLVRLLDSLPTVESCILTGITFIEETPIHRRLFRPASALRILRASGCGDGTLLAQPALTSSLLASQKLVRFDSDGPWGLIFPVMLALFPSAWGLRTGMTSSIQGLDHGCCCVLGAHNEDEVHDVSVTARTFFRTGGPSSSSSFDLEQKSPAAAFDIEILIGTHAQFARKQLDEFEELAMQNLPSIAQTMLLDVRSDGDSFMRILCALLEGALGRTVPARKVDLKLSRATRYRDLGHSITYDEIISAPLQYVREDRCVSLTTSQRAEWLLCRTSNEREAYLEGEWEEAHRSGTGAENTGIEAAIEEVEEADGESDVNSTVAMG